MTAQEIKDIIKQLDFAENDKINYSEFISATINVQDFLTQERLEALFNTFDVDNSGGITRANLKLAFSKFGREVGEDDLNDIMKKHDLAGDKQINLDEFKKMFADE